jgi:hypothetical protein
LSVSIRRSIWLAVAVGALLLTCALWAAVARAQVGPCAAPGNAIVAENCKPGNPASEWDVSGAGNSGIQGFATDISVDQGQTVQFKIDSATSLYRLDIYRMGWYGGDGARRVATVRPLSGLSQQPSCLSQSATGLVDCGNWSVSASWVVPADAVSGIYFARLVREDSAGGASHVMFVVRDDDGRSELLFQTSDTTWQAYNQYGGNSLYTGGPAGRAYKVSYNRPFTTRQYAPEDWVFNAEYPMVRWLERNGYDVSYFTGVDSQRLGDEILEHETFLSVGHDEYWSGGQRANVEAARAAGVNLAFFSGNEVFWKTRWEPSINASAGANRTLVSFKETHANAKIDPLPGVWTGTWRDPRFSPPADGGRPENALTGQLFMVNDGATTAIRVPAADGQMRLWRDTNIATLAAGATATLTDGTLGYEWDVDPDNGQRPPGSFRMSSTTVNNAPVLQDYGSTYASATATHNLTLYRHQSGALVFGAGTVQWSWGLDANHDRGAAAADTRMQQATANLLADMGAQPAALQTGLVQPTPTTDTTAPTSTITSPANGAQLQGGQQITITGTATDAGGGAVGAMEVSTDGGTTWRLASGRGSWSYQWTPPGSGSVTIRSRAVDDSGNRETPSAGVVTGEGGSGGSVMCPCSIWNGSTLPANETEPGDTSPVEVGVKFRAQVDGQITGLRFYKGTTNTGTHVGHLWSRSGTLLAEATFTGETARGWQEVTLSGPVPVTAGTTYVASYHAPVGRYAWNRNYFTGSGVDNGPLRALADGEDGGNGVYGYGPSSTFPTGTYLSENYWVDVVFQTSTVDTAPPTVRDTSPVPDATNVSPATNVTASFSEAMDAATISGGTFELRGPGGGLVNAGVSYDAGSRTATLDPAADLNESTTYSATVKGGPSGVKDRAGNALVSDRTWSFRTADPPPPRPDDGPGGPIIAITKASNPFSRYYAEILRNEGLNEFTTKDISTVTAATLAGHDVAILGDMALTPAQVQMLTGWVNTGGNLIAMRPDKQLAGLLGLVDASGTLGNAYLRSDTSRAPGAGIVDQTVQFHGTADRYVTNGASTVATLYATAGTSTPNPAVTVRDVGSGGGQAAAFTFDLARSIIYTRQGNPAWNGQERDGVAPIRSDDLFFGGALPDWNDLAKVAIPQADELQRLLANLIAHVNADRKPLPRFWYFPRGEKAVVIMTGDDHGNGGTAGRFNGFRSASPAGCSVAQWECVRGSSYIYPNTPLTNAAAAAYVADGFEVALHVDTGCANYTPTSLQTTYASQLADFANRYPGVPAPATNRTHCIVWSDWASQAKIELQHGVRLDTNYYYWPPQWVANAPGFFTGSGMPMRFADLDGTMIDVYQATTQMTDESGQSYPFTVDTLLDRALGATGYYGAFTANMHTDSAQSSGSDAIVASALNRGVPVVTGRQLLEWLDGRNRSSFDSIAYSGGTLTFRVTAGSAATGLRGMLPASFGNETLGALTRDGNPVSFTREVIKGVEFAFFPASSGVYEATYAPDTAPPNISGITAAAAANGTATISWTTDEPSDSRVEYGTDPGSLGQSASAPGVVTSHSVQLTGLTPGATYHYRVRSADGSGNAGTSPAPPAPPANFRVPETVNGTPGSVVVQTGTLAGGGAPSLAADDNNYLLVNSTTSGTRTTAWYGSFTGVTNALSNLRVAYTGRNSASCTQAVHIWRWTTSTWIQLNSRSVGTTEIALADLAPTGLAADYVSGTAGDGEVRVRVRCTRNASFVANADLMRLTYQR